MVRFVRRLAAGQVDKNQRPAHESRRTQMQSGGGVTCGNLRLDGCAKLANVDKSQRLHLLYGQSRGMFAQAHASIPAAVANLQVMWNELSMFQGSAVAWR